MVESQAEIRAIWAAGDADALARRLGQLKLELARRGALLTTSGPDAALAQLVAEYSVLLAAQRGDWALLERAYQQVRPFYDAVPAPRGDELRLPLAGMHPAPARRLSPPGERRGLPPPTYRALVQHLVDARLRDELVAASESAYASLSVEDACKLFRFASADELLAYGKLRGWVVTAGVLRFHAERRFAAASIDAQLLVAQTLDYAKELERIV